MSIWHAITILFLIAVIVIQFYTIYRIFAANMKLQEIVKNYGNSLSDESNWRIQMWTAMMILLMTIAIKDVDRDRFVQLYNRLYFYGVPKDVLDDSDKLNDFLNDCIQHKFNVVDAEQPYSYRFIRKENETRS